MDQRARPASETRAERGAGTELWLLRPGPPAELATALRSFAATDFRLVLAPPGAAEEEWARALAAARGTRLELCAELACEALPPAERHARATRLWPAIEHALQAGHPCALVVLGPEALWLVVARALELPFERSAALRVDPGRAVLLRDDPIGIVLRRSNARAPETAAGTALPAPESRG